MPNSSVFWHFHYPLLEGCLVFHGFSAFLASKTMDFLRGAESSSRRVSLLKRVVLTKTHTSIHSGMELSGNVMHDVTRKIEIYDFPRHQKLTRMLCWAHASTSSSGMCLCSPTVVPGICGASSYSTMRPCETSCVFRRIPGRQVCTCACVSVIPHLSSFHGPCMPSRERDACKHTGRAYVRASLPPSRPHRNSHGGCQILGSQC